MTNWDEIMRQTAKIWLEKVLIADEKPCKLLNVRKRNRNFAKGDFVVNFPSCVDISRFTEAQASVSLGCKGEQQLSSVLSDNVLHIKVDRTQLFKSVANEMLLATEPNELGSSITQGDHDHVMLVQHYFESVERSTEECQLDKYRVCFLTDQLESLLVNRQCEVTRIHCRQNSGKSRDSCMKFEDQEKISSTVYDALKTCEFLVTEMSTTDQDAGVCLDLRKVAAQYKYKIGKEGFDATACSANVKVKDRHIQDLTALLEASKLNAKSFKKVVHICPTRLQHLVQEVMLLWSAVQKEHIHQIIIPCAPVKPRKPVQSSKDVVFEGAEDILNVRKQSAKQSYEAKYGQKFSDDAYDQMCQQVAECAVKFEFLSTHHNSPVCLDVSGSYNDPGGGIFVLYNCSRLTTLFRNFEEKVKLGIYPKLPMCSDIDFSLLKEEEEWALFFNFVISYNTVVSDVTKNLTTDRSGRMNFPSHKICQFLFNLSHVFSAYYNRVHILGEAKPHLFPTMMARLTLLKLVHKVMIDLLKLVQTEPLAEM